MKRILIMKRPLSPILPALAACLAVLSAQADYLAEFEARASLLVDWVADSYQPPGGSNPYTSGGISDPEKYTGPKMLARFTKYGPEDTAGAARGTFPYPPVDTNANTWFDEGAKVRNFFHFRFVGPAGIIWKFPTAPAVQEHTVTYLGGNDDPRVQQDFVFKRVDNYNAFTGEGTENHINMNRTSAYLFAAKAAELYAEDPGAYPNFATAETRLQEMRQWILDWSGRVYEVGFGEWDSATYAAFNAMGWLQVYDIAGPDYIDDPAIRAAARAVLDLYAASLALKRTQGQMGGAESRANRRYDRMNDGTAYLSWLWFEEGTDPPPDWRGNNPGYAVYAAISEYRPPLAIVELARKQVAIPQTYHNLKPSYILREPGQGVEVFHIGDGYTLGSVNLNIGGFSAATWQIVNWKLLTVSPDSPFPKEIWGNGGYYGVRGNTRDPFNQIVQHENLLIQMSYVPANADALTGGVYGLYGAWETNWEADFRERFAERDYGGWGDGNPINSQPGSTTGARSSHILHHAAATRQVGDNAVFLELNDTFVAVMSIRNTLPLTDTNQISDTGNADELLGLIMEVGARAEHGSLTAFRSQIEANLAAGALDLSERDSALTVRYTKLDGDVVSATYATEGNWIEPDYDWDYGVTTPGGVTTMHLHDWRQPDWPSGTGHGRQPEWSVNGIIQNPGQWSVYAGPGFRLADRRLQFLKDDSIVYEVDYRGDVPLFIIPVDQAVLNIASVEGTVVVAFPPPAGVKSVRLRLSSDLANWATIPADLIDTSGPLWSFTLSSGLLETPAFFQVEIVP